MVFFFPKDVALASMIILALGDSIAPLIGRYGRIRHPFSKKKFLEGAIIGFIAGFIGAIIFVEAIPALIASLVAMIIEGIDLEFRFNPLDDNIFMPLISGLVILLMRTIF